MMATLITAADGGGGERGQGGQFMKKTASEKQKWKEARRQERGNQKRKERNARGLSKKNDDDGDGMGGRDRGLGNGAWARSGGGGGQFTKKTPAEKQKWKDARRQRREERQAKTNRGVNMGDFGGNDDDDNIMNVKEKKRAARMEERELKRKEREAKRKARRVTRESAEL